MKIALAGNPNSGKTTMFNALTGRNERVGNWAGVTVDKKESYIKKSFNNCGEEIVAIQQADGSISDFFIYRPERLNLNDTLSGIIRKHDTSLNGYFIQTDKKWSVFVPSKEKHNEEKTHLKKYFLQLDILTTAIVVRRRKEKP